MYIEQICRWVDRCRDDTLLKFFFDCFLVKEEEESSIESKDGRGSIGVLSKGDKIRNSWLGEVKGE